MQQGMMAMFGMITQLYTHTGLALQQPGQPGLQGVGAPQLAVTPAPAPTTAKAGYRAGLARLGSARAGSLW